MHKSRVLDQKERGNSEGERSETAWTYRLRGAILPAAFERKRKGKKKFWGESPEEFRFGFGGGELLQESNPVWGGKRYTQQTKSVKKTPKTLRIKN